MITFVLVLKIIRPDKPQKVTHKVKLPPLGLFLLSSCYSTQQAVRTAKDKNP